MLQIKYISDRVADELSTTLAKRVATNAKFINPLIITLSSLDMFMPDRINGIKFGFIYIFSIAIPIQEVQGQWRQTGEKFTDSFEEFYEGGGGVRGRGRGHFLFQLNSQCQTRMAMLVRQNRGIICDIHSSSRQGNLKKQLILLTWAWKLFRSQGMRSEITNPQYPIAYANYTNKHKRINILRKFW